MSVRHISLHPKLIQFTPRTVVVLFSSRYTYRVSLLLRHERLNTHLLYTKTPSYMVHVTTGTTNMSSIDTPVLKSLGLEANLHSIA